MRPNVFAEAFRGNLNLAKPPPNSVTTSRLVIGLHHFAVRVGSRFSPASSDYRRAIGFSRSSANRPLPAETSDLHLLKPPHLDSASIWLAAAPPIVLQVFSPASRPRFQSLFVSRLPASTLIHNEPDAHQSRIWIKAFEEVTKTINVPSPLALIELQKNNRCQAVSI